MSDYTPYIPYILYAAPFVVAAFVLMKAWLDERRVEDAEEIVEFMPSDDPMIEELRSKPMRRTYVSYTT